MAINNVNVATTGSVVFLSSGNQAITTIIFCNNDASTTANINVYAVPYNGGAGIVGTGTIILKNLSLPAEETFVMDTEKLILANGDKIVATAISGVANSVVATISSVGI